MRRFLFWYLPLGAAMIAACVFAYGFAMFLRGDIGTPVDVAPARAAAPPPAATRQLVPLILGDSLAHGAGDETGEGISGRLDRELRTRHLPARRTVNLGIDGARTADLLATLEKPNVRHLISEANVVIISIGGNDLWGGADWRSAPPANPDAVMNVVLARIETIVKTVHELNPKARVFYVGLYNPFAQTPPGRLLSTMVNRWNARLEERFGTDPTFTLVPTADLFTHHDRLALDRFHPGGEAYGMIARRIADGV